MCGIAGLLLDPSITPVDRLDAIEAMTTSLRHRGPDGSGFWSDPVAGVALGHRRLAIVDLTEAGHQPMVSHGGGLVTTYNGEIYNLAGQRAALAAKGVRFRGHSDTEVMLAAFADRGLAASLPGFAGMFALAVWDRGARTLHLARDCMGKKPLYIALVDGVLAFASELRAFAALPDFRAAVDPDAVALLLRHGFVPDDRCIYRDVFKLPPGTMLSVRATDLATASAASLRGMVRRWWSLDAVAAAGQRRPPRQSPADFAAELEAVLSVAVAERMVADVPLGAFLSGGIDSSIVVALMQAQAPRPVRTFTIGFDEDGYDEAAAAAAIARHIGTDHTEFRVTAAAARDVIPDLPTIWDEPFADELQIPTFLVSRLARESVTVALSGDGGDECFGGYARHLLAARMGSLFSVPAPLRAGAGAGLALLGAEVANGWLRTLPLPIGLRRTLGGTAVQKLARVLGAADDAALYARLTRLGTRSLALNAEPGSAIPDAPPLPDVAARCMARDMAFYLPGDILAKLDRASMAVSLETRCPLLDRRVVEFAWSVPTAWKIRGGTGKWLLRQVLARHVPCDLFERPKHGFNVPIGAWLRGPLRDWAADLLAEPQLRSGGLLDPPAVAACWREHRGGRRDRAAELWPVLMLQAWLQNRPSHHARPIRPARQSYHVMHEQEGTG